MRRELHLSYALTLSLLGGCLGSEAGGATDPTLRPVYDRARDCELLDAEGDYPGFVDDEVDDPELACLHRCLARAKCGDLEPVFCGQVPIAGSACATSCYSEKCNDGTPLPESFVCDGFDDCADHSDESACPTFTCSDGQVIPQSFVCSGFPDCIDESDERDCPAPVSDPTFACDDGDEIPLAAYCDGLVHCSDGSDERGCAEPICPG